MSEGPDAFRKNPERTWDAVKSLHQDMRGREPTPEAVAEAVKFAQEAGFVLEAPVRLQGNVNGEIGKVAGYNERTAGFYPGTRYPILVKFERGTFEYGPEVLELVRVKKGE